MPLTPPSRRNGRHPLARTRPKAAVPALAHTDTDMQGGEEDIRNSTVQRLRWRRLTWRGLLTEQGRPQCIRDHARAPWLIVATVCIGAFMGQLDASIVTIALPDVRTDLGASLTAITWVSLSYLVVLVGTVAAVGRLADMIGRKLLYTYGFVVFTLASLGCGLAPNLTTLLAFRVVQAIGAAMLQANSVALIVGAVPRDALSRAIGLQAAAQALGLSLGPALGGLLTNAGGWRWIFYINIPTGILGCALGWVLLPRTRLRAARTAFDWPGLALLFLSVTAGLIGLSQAATDEPAHPGIWLALTGSATLGWAFIRRQARTDAPLIDLELLRRRDVASGLGSGMLASAVLFGTLFAVPLHLTNSGGLSIAFAGLALTALPLAIGLTAPTAGALSRRYGVRRTTVLGMLASMVGVVVTAGCVAALTRSANGAAGDAAVGLGAVAATEIALAIIGVGLGLFTPVNNAAVMSAVRPQESGSASGVLNMTRALGSAFGVSVTSVAFGVGGFAAAATVLAGCAALAAVIACCRPARQGARTDPPTSVEQGRSAVPAPRIPARAGHRDAASEQPVQCLRLHRKTLRSRHDQRVDWT
ncbi:MFS transporter [Protofrankia symbiont of Coriaria ruscifolia]|uniref:MFS transporter n=1 Tax=Protofrankia symbiont of Coriaria ruscifolia TaxID=1306542 RepID=UPI001A94CD7E|nr:MFS transporter [Protofrankia symbiont of Coriaria ruscifolia]